MEYYRELRSKNARNIKALMCPLYVEVVQGVHKVLHTLKIFISQKPHKVETLHFRLNYTTIKFVCYFLQVILLLR